MQPGFRQNVDPTLRRKTNKSLTELTNLKNYYEQCKQSLAEAEASLNKEKDNLDQAGVQLEEARNRLSEAQTEVDADYLPEGAQPRARIQHRDDLVLEVKQLEAAFQAQRQATHASSENFISVEKVFIDAERAVCRTAENLEDVFEAKALIAQMDKDKNDRVARLEKQVANRKKHTAQLEKEAMEAQAREAAELDRQRNKTVKKLNSDAKQKILESNTRTLEVTTKVKEVNEAHLQNRTDAVLELKANTDAARADVAALAEKHVRKVQKAKKQLEDEKESLLTQGLNPYVEFRKKELDEDARRRESKLKSAVEQNKVNLAAQLAEEKKVVDKQDKAKIEAEKYEKKHRESLGRHVVEERNRVYIVSKTAAHTEVLDPSGKASRVDPSQIIDIPDFSFGLGKSSRIPTDNMKRITDKIRQELQVDRSELGEYGRLVSGLQKATGVTSISPEKTRTREDDESSINIDNSKGVKLITDRELDDLENLGNYNGIIPGIDKAITSINLNNDVEKSVLLQITTEDEGKIADDAKRIESVASPRYKPVALSKFERDALDRAVDRQRDRVELGVSQVAGGKVFKGDSFASTPGVLLFKDFDVGKVYKKHFALTNVSYSFNSFKLLDIDDEYIDFFTIKYDKPGRMSAGMSCSLDITFKPQLNKDIHTFVRLLTETGPVDIPLECLIKRCAPKIVDTVIDFQELIVGQKVTMPVKIVNTQALSTRFRVEEVIVEENESDLSNSILPSNLFSGQTTTAPNDDSAPEEEPKLSIAVDSENPETNAAAETDPWMVHPGNEPELWNRMQKIMTRTIRKKHSDQPRPFVCYYTTMYPMSNNPDGEGEESNTSASKKNSSNEILIQDGIVPGYDSLQLTVRCAPLAIGMITKLFKVTFYDVDEALMTEDENHELIKRQQFIEVRVFVQELPVFVDQEVIDIKCLLYQRIYRQKVLIRNRGKISYRVNIKVPSYLQDYIEINPAMFFIQANDSQHINVKFVPNLNLFHHLPYYISPNENFHQGGLITLPIQLQVVNQDLPVYFILRSLITTSHVEISDTELNYGKIYLGQKVMKKVLLRNPSMLPQKVAFVRLKKEFSISPNDGFYILLPNESIEIDVAFQPSAAVEYDLDLTILTSFNDTYHIHVHGEGVVPPLELSSTVLQLRHTLSKEHVTESFFITNHSPVAQTFEIMVPNKLFTWITVSPTCLHLQPQETCRIEVDFFPQTKRTSLWEYETMKEWYDDMIQSNLAPVTDSPYEDIVTDHPWMTGKGKFGFMQWAIRPNDPYANAAKAAVRSSTLGDDEEGNEAVHQEPGNGPEMSGESNDQQTPTEEEKKTPALETISWLPEDWGIFSQWNLPILVKPKKKSGQPPAGTAATGTSAGVTTATTAVNASLESTTLANTMTNMNMQNYTMSHKPLPLFIRIETMVTLPQLTSDMSEMDFGQLAIGTRLLKSFTIFNHSSTEYLVLHSVGFNAMGPFTLLRPIKRIPPKETRIVVVECLPKLPGLNVEVLHLYQVKKRLVSESNSGANKATSSTSHGEEEDYVLDTSGHRLQITCRVQGLMPSISLHQLLPPPKTWNPRSGMIDFGQILVSDMPIVRKFTIKNHSTFTIQANIQRVLNASLPFLTDRQNYYDKTVTGLPIISLRPEQIAISAGQSEDIEVLFRPDHLRVLPYREEFDIIVGETDEILRVGMVGRVWCRQYQVLPELSQDELLYNNAFATATLGGMEDPLSYGLYDTVRVMSLDTKKAMALSPCVQPDLILQFPNPFAAVARVDSYTLIDPNAATSAPPGKGGGGKGGAPPTAATSTTGSTAADTAAATATYARRQSKKVRLFSAKSGNIAREVSTPGSYEILLSGSAKASGLFTISSEKGVLTTAKDEWIDIQCTQPPPRELGGVPVGSWKTYDLVVVLKGGWFPSNETEEQRVIVKLMAFVSV